MKDNSFRFVSILSLSLIIPYAHSLSFLQCGNATFREDQYKCFDDQLLCPLVRHKEVMRCGAACYYRTEYSCINDMLVYPLIQEEPFYLTVEASDLPIHGKKVQACRGHFWVQESPSQTLEETLLTIGTKKLKALGHFFRFIPPLTHEKMMAATSLSNHVSHVCYIPNHSNATSANKLKFSKTLMPNSRHYLRILGFSKRIYGGAKNINCHLLQRSLPSVVPFKAAEANNSAETQNIQGEIPIDSQIQTDSSSNIDKGENDLSCQSIKNTAFHQGFQMFNKDLNYPQYYYICPDGSMCYNSYPITLCASENWKCIRGVPEGSFFEHFGGEDGGLLNHHSGDTWMACRETFKENSSIYKLYDNKKLPSSIPGTKARFREVCQQIKLKINPYRGEAPFRYP